MIINLLVGIGGLVLIGLGICGVVLSIVVLLHRFYIWLGDFINSIESPNKKDVVILSVICLHAVIIGGFVITLVSWPWVPNLGLYWRWVLCHCAGSPQYLPGPWDR